MPAAQPAAAKKKKEKPLVKTPVPGTDWTRVLTTEGNTFYSNKTTKQSVWTVPDGIEEEVAALEKEEEEERLRQEQAKVEEEQKKKEEEMTMEVERIKGAIREAFGKRKADGEPTKGAMVSKKPRVEDAEDDDEGEESEEEDWQREAAAQLAAEAEEIKRLEEEEKRLAEEEARRAEEDLKAKQRELNIPDKVNLSLDEAKALFKVCVMDPLSTTGLIIQDVDTASREGHQSPASMGQVTASFCVRSPLCPPPLSNCATRCLRRLLP